MSDTTTKFTPGPWSVHNETKSQHGMAWGGYWQIDGKYDAVACNQYCYANSNEETSKANALLIAAAPELYEALQAWLAAEKATEDSIEHFEQAIAEGWADEPGLSGHVRDSERRADLAWEKARALRDAALAKSGAVA